MLGSNVPAKSTFPLLEIASEMDYTPVAKALAAAASSASTSATKTGVQTERMRAHT